MIDRDSDRKDESKSLEINEISKAWSPVQGSQQAMLQGSQPSETQANSFFNRPQAQASQKNTHIKPYIWTEARPGILYHPDSWLLSLDDIPQKLFRTKQTENLGLRRKITKYITSNAKIEKLQAPEWDINNVKDKIPSRDLLFLSVFDLAQEEQGDDMFRLVKSGRADRNPFRKALHLDVDPSDSDYNSDSDEDLEKTLQVSNTSLDWSKLLDNYPPVSYSLTKLAGDPIQLLDHKQREEFAKEYQRELFNRLNDSVRISECYIIKSLQIQLCLQISDGRLWSQVSSVVSHLDIIL